MVDRDLHNRKSETGFNNAMGKLKAGDVFEIVTAKGNGYLQFACTEDDGTDLMRILPGLYSDRPENIEGIVSQKELFLIHFPLSAAVRRKLFCFVSNFPLPDGFAKPMFMRTTHVVRGECLGWHIVNTKTLERQFVETLSESQRKLSPWGVWNDTLLKERLEEGWTLENW